MVDLEIGKDGVTFDFLTKASRIPPVEAKTYEFQVDDITDSNTQDGRPRWVTWLKIINDPKYPNSRLPYGCLLPWINPTTGQWDVSNSFLLVNLLKGTGKTFQGDIRQAPVQQALKDTLKGATGFMRVGQRPNRDDPHLMDNTVAIVAGKRK